MGLGVVGRLQLLKPAIKRPHGQASWAGDGRERARSQPESYTPLTVLYVCMDLFANGHTGILFIHTYRIFHFKIPETHTNGMLCINNILKSRKASTHFQKKIRGQHYFLAERAQFKVSFTEHTLMIIPKRNFEKEGECFAPICAHVSHRHVHSAISLDLS